MRLGRESTPGQFCGPGWRAGKARLESTEGDAALRGRIPLLKISCFCQPFQACLVSAPAAAAAAASAAAACHRLFALCAER